MKRLLAMPQGAFIARTHTHMLADSIDMQASIATPPTYEVNIAVVLLRRGAEVGPRSASATRAGLRMQAKPPGRSAAAATKSRRHPGAAAAGPDYASLTLLPIVGL